MNALEIVKAAIPEANEDIVDYILWERTPYPVGSVSAKKLYKTASRLKRAENNNIRLCDLCDNMLQASDKYTCKRCSAILAEH